MKKVHILFTAALLLVGLGMAASADPCAGAKCCAQQGLQAGWFTGTGTLAHAGHDYKADGSCCTNAKTASKAACSCADSKADGSCCGGKSDGKSDGKAAGGCGGSCSSCKK